MDFDTFISQAWDEHADATEAVAARLETEGLAAVRAAADDSRIGPLARIAHHVFGEHLGQWQRGIRLQRQLAQLPFCGAAHGDLTRRFMASLALAAGEPGARAALPLSERIAAAAHAASALAERDSHRAAQLYQQAADEAGAASLPKADLALRALATSGWNLACALEEKPSLSADERALMILAAEGSRRFWGLAGTWVEAERGEYRLAMTWLKAGEPARALGHAQQCLRIVSDNHNAPLERFFGLEALAFARAAVGDGAAARQAAREGEAAYAALDAADLGWCEPTVKKLRALAASP